VERLGRGVDGVNLNKLNMNMTSPKKYLFVADIIFALVSTWFFFPQCKIPLWMRLIWVAFVYGINMWFFYHDNHVMWLFVHMHYYSPLCLWVFLAAVYGWLATRSKSEKSAAWWNWSTDNFFQKHPRLIWSIIIAVYLFLIFLFYSIWHSMKP
jgi:hypothetical protein